MEKLKDFIYDKNDILISFVILAFAALIIMWRMDAIMDYPAKMLEKGAETGQTVPSALLDDEDDKEDTDDTQSSQTGALWSGGLLTRDVTVNVTGNSATEAIQCLVSAGLFKDYAEYQSVCKEEDLNHEKVSSGTFTFKKGWSKAKVADAVNWT